ncbi:MAG: hypothetical protein II328_02130 [Clostridia bacterium]|nr:hypothetical protein [Clostridia bacterium]
MKHTRTICLLLLFLLLPALVACQTPEEALLSQAKAAIEDGEFETAHELLSALPEEPDAQDLLRRFEWTWGSESTVSTDGKILVTTHTYGLDGCLNASECKSEAWPEEYTYTYDENQNLVRKIYHNKLLDLTTTYEYYYDEENRLEKEISTSPLWVTTIAYSHNSDGLIVLAEKNLVRDGTTFSQETIRYSYNENKLCTKRESINDENEITTTLYRYKGNRLQTATTTDHDGETEVKEYTYNHNGAPIKLVHTYSDGRVSTTTYSDLSLYYYPNRAVGVAE